MLNYTLLGNRIRETRKQRNISQAKLAELANLSVSHISYIENAQRNVSLSSLVIIANVMEITVDVLLIGNQHRNKGEYHDELLHLLDDCTDYEKRILSEQVLSLKTSLRDNHYLL